ncbi:MAG: sulfatase-like hydrolase/transferase [Acidobacteriota bacterium]|nr:sulfatase-like hydrolase/transferase [Acidobacteriota bacterium]
MKLDRRTFLQVAAGAAVPATAPAPKPNIVMILCDDLGYSDLGCYGNRIIQTPNLDKLATKGTRFTQFYTTSPVCSPSRAALMTGMYPQRFGIHHADLPESLPRYFLPESATLVSKVLQKAGYYTAHVGKWHLGEPPQTVVPRKQGFDYFFGCFGGRPSSPWMKYSRSQDPEIIVNENRPVVYKGHVTKVQTDAALDVLSKSTRDRPFFLNLWYNAPHEPLTPIDHQKELYRDWSPEEQTYFQTVTDVDKGVGQILAKLDEMGVADNTLVLFSSDNGPEAHSFKFSRGSAWPLRGMKTQLWDGGVREPGILRWPGKVPAGRVSNAVASFLDVFPTFCIAAGVAIPEGLTLDGGMNLVRIANGDLDTMNRSLFFEFHFPQRGVASSLPVAVRRGKWKLFSNFTFDTFELYDMGSDVGERNDISAQYAPVVRSLKQELQRWLGQFVSTLDLNAKTTRVPPPSPEELEKRYYKN